MKPSVSLRSLPSFVKSSKTLLPKTSASCNFCFLCRCNIAQTAQVLITLQGKSYSSLTTTRRQGTNNQLKNPFCPSCVQQGLIYVAEEEETERGRKEGRKPPSPPSTFFHFLAHRGSVQACKGGGGGGGRECLFAKRRKEGGDLCWPPLPPLLAPRGEEDGKLVSSCPFLFQQLSFFSLPSLFPSLLCFSPAVVSSACAKLKGTGLTLAFSRFRGENVFVFRPPAPQADEEQAEAQQEPFLHHAHTGLAHMNYVNT